MKNKELTQEWIDFAKMDFLTAKLSDIDRWELFRNTADKMGKRRAELLLENFFISYFYSLFAENVIK